MAGRVEGKIALVTGGASGIGRATAIKFAQEGAKVAVADIAVAGGEETVQMIEKAGGEAIFIKTDLPRHMANDKLVEELIPNDVHLNKLKEAGSFEKILQSNLLEEVEKLKPIYPALCS